MRNHTYFLLRFIHSLFPVINLQPEHYFPEFSRSIRKIYACTNSCLFIRNLLLYEINPRRCII